MQVRFSEIRGKEAFNGGGEPLGKIINALVDPRTEEAFIVTVRTKGKIGSSVVPVSRLKNIDANEIIFSISGVPGENYPLDYDSFLSDRPNPGSLNAQVYSLNKKKVLGMIYDYVFETENGTRAAVLIEEVTMGSRRKFFAPTGKAFRAEDRAIGTRKILINPIELQQIE